MRGGAQHPRPDAAGLALLVGLDDRPQDASEVGQIGADPLRAPQHSNRVHGRRDRRLDVVAHRGIAARDQIGVGGGERRRRRRLAPRVRHPQRQAVRQRPIDQGGPPAAPRQRHAARNGQCGRRQQPQASSGRHGTSFKGVSPSARQRTARASGGYRPRRLRHTGPVAISLFGLVEEGRLRHRPVDGRLVVCRWFRAHGIALPGFACALDGEIGLTRRMCRRIGPVLEGCPELFRRSRIRPWVGALVDERLKPPVRG